MFIFSYKNYYGATLASLVNIFFRLIALALAVAAFIGIGGGLGTEIFGEIAVLKVIFIILASIVALAIFFIGAAFIDRYTDNMAKKAIVIKLMKSRKFAEKLLKAKPDTLELIQQFYPDIKDPKAPIPETISS